MKFHQQVQIPKILKYFSLLSVNLLNALFHIINAYL